MFLPNLQAFCQKQEKKQNIHVILFIYFHGNNDYSHYFPGNDVIFLLKKLHETLYTSIFGVVIPFYRSDFKNQVMRLFFG